MDLQTAYRFQWVDWIDCFFYTVVVYSSIARGASVNSILVLWSFFFFTVFLNKRLSLLDAFHLLNATRLGSWASLRSFTGTELVFLLTTTPRGGGYSLNPWVGRCGPAPHTQTLFKTKIADFPSKLFQNR